MNVDVSWLSLMAQASVLVKGVMLVLLLASLASWTFIFQRGRVLRHARTLFCEFETRFRRATDLEKVYDHIASRREKSAGIENVFKAGFREFINISKQSQHSAQQLCEHTERAMRIALAKEEQHLEHRLAFLATVGSLSVYVGLLGTVWGIMSAFQGLGQTQSATLATVAPGISEALIATAMGLFAAIPAVYAYNRYLNQVQRLLKNYDMLAEEFAGVLAQKAQALVQLPPKATQRGG